MLEDNLISTQTDLNPENDNMLLYKQIASVLSLIIFVILYFLTKNKINIFFILMFLIISTILLLPNKKVILYEDTKIYILPTQLSTIYKTLQYSQEVEILKQRGDFFKILFKNKHIGWVKKEDVE
jgi:hypothetical protein